MIIIIIIIIIVIVIIFAVIMSVGRVFIQIRSLLLQDYIQMKEHKDRLITLKYIEEFDKDTKVKEKGRTSVGQRSELFTKL